MADIVSRLLDLPRLLLRVLCLRMKHFVLGWAHPLPRKIEVYRGEEGTLEHAILTRVMESVHEAELAPDEGGSTPVMMLDGTRAALGWQAIARYLAAIDRTMPTAPLTSLKVNMFMEIVSTSTTSRR